MRISDWSSDVCSSDLSSGTRPAGARLQRPVELGEVRNAGAGKAQEVEALHEGANGAAGEALLLAGEEQVPDAMLLGREGMPVLRDRPILGRARRARARAAGWKT